MRIDVHAHAFPTDYLDLLARHGDEAAAGLAGLGAGDRPGEVETRLDLMDASGIDISVLSSSSLIPTFEDVERSVAAARTLNDAYLAMAGSWPARLRVFASLPLPHLDAALDELDRVLAEPAVVGVAVTTAVLGRSIADAAFEPLFEELDRRAATLFIHPAGRGAGSPLIGPTGLSWAIGAPIEDTISVVHLMARGIPTRYPAIRIINAHLGGAVPMLLQRLENQYPRAFPDAPERPTEAFRRMWFDTVGHGHRPALVAAVASFGADRLVLGTDYPYVRGDHYPEAVAYIGEAGLAAGAADAILDETAAAVLRLG